MPIAVTTACILGVAENAGAQIRISDFANIDALERSGIEVNIEASSDPVEREPPLVIESEFAPPSPDASLARPLAQLMLDAAALRRIRGIPSDIERRPVAPLVEFSLGRMRVRMAAIESSNDPDFEAVHLTLIDTGSDDYGRLTVSTSGPEIVGTFIIDDNEYRLLPENEAFQSLHAVLLQGRVWRRESPPDLESRAGQLEARHLQMGWVAEHRPDDFNTLPDGRLEAYRGTGLGVLHFWDAVQFDAAGNVEIDTIILEREAERFMNSVQGFTWIYEPLELRVEPYFETDHVALTNTGLSLVLVQHIDGIPFNRSFRLTMAPTGDVVQFSGLLMRRDMRIAAREYPIPEHDAHASAQQALVNRHGIEISDELSNEEVFYAIVSNSELELIWRMTIEAKCGMSFSVDINGFTGEARDIGVVSTGGIEVRRFAGLGRAELDDYILQCRIQMLR